tara:strand:- start:7 stop:828 length:822 start_codon:yes stop_codon:yes gene_type:complete
MSTINEKIKESIVNCEPNTFGKIGGFESSHLAYYIQTGKPTLIRGQSLAINAGINVSSQDDLKTWCDAYLSAIKNLDYVLEWCPDQGDQFVIEKVWRGKEKFYSFQDLEPFSHGNKGWHYALKDKTVLVISPFKDSIEQQVKNYSNIWKGAEIGEVKVIKSPYPPALTGEKDPPSYQRKLNEMKKEILSMEFDFATVGCGGYSLILLDFIKRLGKPCVHLGGANQILFGIKGKRWDNNPGFTESDWYGTADWIRPLPHEIPPNARLVEGACYW